MLSITLSTTWIVRTGLHPSTSSPISPSTPPMSSLSAKRPTSQSSSPWGRAPSPACSTSCPLSVSRPSSGTLLIRRTQRTTSCGTPCFRLQTKSTVSVIPIRLCTVIHRLQTATRELTTWARSSTTASAMRFKLPTIKINFPRISSIRSLREQNYIISIILSLLA